MDIKSLIQECIEEVLSEGRRICAWCGKDLGEAPGNKDTHGMCPSCLQKELDSANVRPPPPKPK